MEKRRRSLQVVLTREENASLSMSIKLRELHFKPIIFPTVQFARVYPDYTGPQDFSDVDWIVFPTARAVQYFFKRFKQKLDSSVKVFSLGPAVQNELEKLNIQPAKSTDSNSLIELRNFFSTVQPGRILFPCGKSSLGSLDAKLKSMGFEVNELPLYTTEPPAEFDESKLEIIKKGYYDIITFASSSSVKHLMIVLKGKVGIFKGKTAIVLGKETENLLKGSSFSRVIRAKNGGERGLINELIDYRKELE